MEIHAATNFNVVLLRLMLMLTCWHHALCRFKVTFFLAHGIDTLALNFQSLSLKTVNFDWFSSPQSDGLILLPAPDVKSRVVFLCHSSTGHPLSMSWYLRAESPRPLVSLGVPTVLPGLDEVLYREAEERKQRQELREQEALHLGFPSRGVDSKVPILIPKNPKF